MRNNYDFSKAKRNPYASRLKKQENSLQGGTSPGSSLTPLRKVSRKK